MDAVLTPPRLTADDALFLDFDGTLAPLQDDRSAVFLGPALKVVLQAVQARLGGAVAVISGRDLSDLARRAPNFLHRIGAHGLEYAGPNAMAPPLAHQAPPKLVRSLEALARSLPGVEVEHKGAVLAVHYRASPEAGPQVATAVAAAVAAFPDYVAQPGKFVVEAKPREANKGRALRNWAGRPPFAGRRLVMVGDDATDEDAFRVALELGGLAIKVGEGETAAPWRLADTDAVCRWLSESLDDDVPA